jgi:hypothetical protein
VYNINELGLQKCTTSPEDETDHSEKTYRCASHEMRIFGAIGSGASSVVQRALHIPMHRILALKKINIFEKVSIVLLAHNLYYCLDARSWIIASYALAFAWTDGRCVGILLSVFNSL